MIGIFGGTFDPIHFGHLRPVEEVAPRIGLSQVRFIPAAAPPHRPPPVAGPEHRLNMVRLAVADRPGFVVDERELHRPGPSYTVLTLESLRAELGSRPLCLLLGRDAFSGLETWHRWREIPELAHLVVVERPTEGAAQELPAWARPRLRQDPQDLARSPAGLILFQQVTPQPVSATAVRAALKRGEPVSDLVPEAVLAYIRENHLYQS